MDFPMGFQNKDYFYKEKYDTIGKAAVVKQLLFAFMNFNFISYDRREIIQEDITPYKK